MSNSRTAKRVKLEISQLDSVVRWKAHSHHSSLPLAKLLRPKGLVSPAPNLCLHITNAQQEFLQQMKTSVVKASQASATNPTSSH